MLDFLIWYLMISILGWLAFPLTYRFFPSLSDRGYAFSRVLGLLLWSYGFWMLASLGVLRNESGGLAFALVGLAGLSAWSLAQIGQAPGRGAAPQRLMAGWQEITAWLRGQRRTILVMELLFLAAFAAWTVVRAAYPDIRYTEKPMEMAFINAILRSETLPPFDPWLSGYAISYYHFGYIMVAMLAKAGGTLNSAAFNLGVALVFGLSTLGVYGLVYNLLAAWRQGQEKSRKPVIQALFGPVLILLVSNIQGFLAVLHARGLLPAAFWSWLNIQDISAPPQAPFSWLPAGYGSGAWWWWRASRVVSDTSLDGAFWEVIDEFPAFSYFLADLHPHVLAMPFAFFAMTLALNLLLSNPEVAGAETQAARQPGVRLELRINWRSLAWVAAGLAAVGITLLAGGVRSASPAAPRTLALGVFGLALSAGVFLYLLPGIRSAGAGLFQREDVGSLRLEQGLAVPGDQLLLAGLALGGLAFLNTWDFPFYVALYAAAYTLRRSWSKTNRSWSGLAGDFLRSGLVVGILGGLLYLPFYLGFSSQAGGLLPNLINPTSGGQMWVMFATLLAPLFIYLLHLRGQQPVQAQTGKPAAPWLAAGGLVLGLWLVSLAFGFLLLLLPAWRGLDVGGMYLAGLGAGSTGELLQAAVMRRWLNPGGWITLLVIAALVIERLRWLHQQSAGTAANRPQAFLLRPQAFVLLLAALGLLLVLVPEFFFLRDQFGTRMNTVFKFYYQAWLMWGVAAAFGTLVLLETLQGWKALLFRVALAALICMGMTYTVLRLWDITSGFSPPFGWSLDGMAFLERERPDELAAIRWLEAAPLGVVSEAVGGSYTDYARVSAFSGQPGVLGWPGHEGQWRGGGREIGSRQDDLARLYCSRSWNETRAVLDQYQIRYVYIGGLERIAYGPATCGNALQEAKFERNLRKVFQQGEVSVYEVPWR